MNAVAYARYSSDNQNESSISAQLRAIHEYAEKNNINIVAEYIDEAKSASTFRTEERPQFEQMLTDIVSEKIHADYILFHKLDRFGRDDYDIARFKYNIRKKNMKIIYVDQPIPDGPEGIILEQLLVGMAKYYSENLSREIKKGMKESALAGKHRGGIPPIGYDVDPKTKNYIINEKEAEIVRKIFTMAANGYGYLEIIDVVTLMGYKGKRNGKVLGRNSINDILHNEKYTGIYVANRYTDQEEIKTPGQMPTIISDELWKEVQAKLEERKHVHPKPKEGGQVYLLTGKITCGECGASYTGNSRLGGSTGKSRYSIYNCTNKRKKLCVNKDIQKEVLENFVLDEIEELFQPEKQEELIKQILIRYKEHSDGADQERKQIQINLADVKKKMDNLLTAIEGGYMEAPIAGPRLNTLKKEKELLQSRLAELDNQPVLSREKVIEYLKLNQQILADRSDLLACKRLVDTYVKNVTLTKDDIKVVLRVPAKSDVSDMVDLKVHVIKPRPPRQSESWMMNQWDY